VEQALGRGGMGVACKAIDTFSGRPVAIKVMRAEGDRASHEHAANLPAHEARTLASLTHPSIVRLLDFDHVQLAGAAVPFLVMEMLRGETLACARRVSSISDARFRSVATWPPRSAPCTRATWSTGT
jgi:serine/threonine-protein kinase